MKIPVKARAIDRMLDGGFEPGILTEIYGEAGTGKTNICMQLGREVVYFGKKVVYIDTEGLSLERLKQICGDGYDQVVKGFLISKPNSLDEQEKTIRQVKRIPDIGLVVVDSVNMYARLISEEEHGVDRAFFRQIILLHNIARELNVPVIVTAQVYSSGQDVLPFSGLIMAHIAKVIIRLEKVGMGLRRAVIMKHRSISEGRTAEFKLTQNGIE